MSSLSKNQSGRWVVSRWLQRVEEQRADEERVEHENLQFTSGFLQKIISEKSRAPRKSFRLSFTK